MNKRCAIFLDRDGVINKISIDDGRPCSPRKVGEFILSDGVGESLKRMKDAGYFLIVITNQPEVSRGLLEKDDLEKMHQILLSELPVIDDLFMCLHDDKDNCNCRKPKPGMVLEAASKWSVDLSSSFFVGDTIKDVQVGKTVGCKTILIDASYNQGLDTDVRVKDMAGVADHIIKKPLEKSCF